MTLTPATPGGRVNTAPSVIQGTSFGAPAGIVAVWAFNTYLLPVPMPAEIGAACGSLVTAAVVWLVQWLPRRG